MQPATQNQTGRCLVYVLGNCVIDALPLTLFAPFSLGFLTSFVSFWYQRKPLDVPCCLWNHKTTSRKIKEGQLLPILDLYCFCGRSRVLARWISTCVSITVNRFCFRFTLTCRLRSSCDVYESSHFWVFKLNSVENSKFRFVLIFKLTNQICFGF